MAFFNPDFTIYEIPKEELDEYIDAYPTSFFIKNDTIQQVVLGRLQSPYTEYRNIYKNLKN